MGRLKHLKKVVLCWGQKQGYGWCQWLAVVRGDTLKKKNLKMTGSQIQLRVGKPLDVNVSLYSSPRTFAEHVRSQVVNLKDSWKAEQEVS